jgi:hypothetical protein
MDSTDIKTVRAELDALGDLVQGKLMMAGLYAYASPLFRPWNLFVIAQRETTVAVFVEQKGMAQLTFLDRRSEPESEQYDKSVWARQAELELAAKVVAVVALAELGADANTKADRRVKSATELAKEAERMARLGLLGDLTGVTHLTKQLHAFLAEHPDPQKNVFIMMRFHTAPQFDEVHQTIVDTLREYGLSGHRADDRAYHPELWANVEVYMTCCHLGIAVFEDFVDRSHNPNVALELGYMRAKQRRVLILKERTLPSVPADIVGSLYKPFNKFEIVDTVRAEVRRWIEVDLGLTA